MILGIPCAANRLVLRAGEKANARLCLDYYRIEPGSQ